ncbi:hypothetical protein HC928_15105, partial [bacterium]|nr:hypothetical protein [bacterium]
MSGCTSPDLTHNELGVPDYPVVNVFVAEDYPGDLRRVVILPVATGEVSAQTRAQLD